MTTLRTAIEELLAAVDSYQGSNGAMLDKAAAVRAALGPEPTDDGMKTEDDGFRVEAADQYGFRNFNDDCTEHRCTTAQLVMFAKGCERKGMYDACHMPNQKFVLARIAEIDAETNPFVEAERQRYLKSRGFEPIDPTKPEAGWHNGGVR